MVLINLKSVLPGAQSANDGFLYETTTSTPVDELIESLVEIHNARLRSCLIADAVKGLAMYGVMKRPEDVGTDHVSLRKKPFFVTNSFVTFESTSYQPIFGYLFHLEGKRNHRWNG